MASAVSVLDVLRDLFGAVFGPSWDAWRVFLRVLVGLPPASDADRALYRRCTGRQQWPMGPAREAWLVCGRRSGKSRLAALLAVFLGCFRTYQLAPGERGIVMLIAADRRQARVVKQYISALLHAVPMLKALIEAERKEAIDLTNGITIEIHTASFRAVRGYTIVAAICDEIAFWPTEDAANPDTEILTALRPAMVTVPDALLLALSSPYARRGELSNAYQRHFGKDGDPVLVWQADTRTMNPTVPQLIIDAAYAEDEARASAEYGAQFRRDIESFLAREAIETCVMPGRHELPRLAGVSYTAFLDFAGGTAGGDSATLGIAHAEQRDCRLMLVLDVVREVRPPFSPEQVCAEFAAVLGAYGISTAKSDRWAGQFPVEQLQKHGIRIKPSEKSKSDLYRALLPLLNSGGVELLDQPRLIGQLSSLERRTARGGKDSIDHPTHPGAHDDVANAAAGALVAATKPSTDPRLIRWCLESGEGEPDPLAERRPLF